MKEKSPAQGEEQAALTTIDSSELNLDSSEDEEVTQQAPSSPIKPIRPQSPALDLTSATIYGQFKSLQSNAQHDDRNGPYIISKLQEIINLTQPSGSIPAEDGIVSGAQKGRKRKRSRLEQGEQIHKIRLP